GSGSGGSGSGGSGGGSGSASGGAGGSGSGSGGSGSGGSGSGGGGNGGSGSGDGFIDFTDDGNSGQPGSSDDTAQPAPIPVPGGLPLALAGLAALAILRRKKTNEA
ncbi:MAG: hypothetical protein AAF965_03770, partial [Pseudomonadota bacterium]